MRLAAVEDHRRDSVKRGEIGVENDALLADGDDQWSDIGVGRWFGHFEKDRHVLIHPGKRSKSAIR